MSLFLESANQTGIVADWESFHHLVSGGWLTLKAILDSSREHHWSVLSPFSLVSLFMALPLCKCDPLRHRINAPQCSGVTVILNYYTIFIPEYSVLNLLENIYDKIINYKGLYCTKVWKQFTVSKVKTFINPHWLPRKIWVLKSKSKVEILTHATV